MRVKRTLDAGPRTLARLVEKCTIPLGFALVLGAGVLGACDGDPNQLRGRRGRAGEETPAGDAGPGAAASAVPLRPLTPYELSNAVGELLGDASGRPILALQPDQIHGAAETLSGGDTTWAGARADRLEAITLEIASKAVSEGPLAACAAKEGDQACVQALFDDLVPRAFRRPATAEERGRFVSVVSSLLAKTSRASALTRALQALLLSPEHLYLSAFGDPTRPFGDGIELTPHELASRLSFFLWASAPDAELAKAADADALRTPEQLDMQVRRMLTDPRAGRGVARYVTGWTDAVNVQRHSKADPEWTAAVAYSAVQETQLFSEDWFRSESPAFRTLFSADYTFVTPSLAALYGLPVPQGQDPVRVNGTKASHRGGVLTQAAFLASHSSITSSSPVFRGLWFVRRVLCQSVGTPPNDTQDKAPKRDGSAQTRDWHEAIATTSGCGSCHGMMNPPGYVFESYDAVGRYRAEEAGKPVRTDATLTAAADMAGSYADANALAAAIGESAVARACFTEGLLTYAMGRPPGDEDKPLLESVSDTLATDVREAVHAVATSPSFRRAPRTP